MSDATAESPLPTRRELRAARGPRRPLLRTLGLGLSAGVLALAVLLGVVAVVVPAVTGSQTYTVLTRSMEPGLPPGTYLIVRPTPVEDLRVGDVITYQLESGKPAVVTHRITRVDVSSSGERRFITQGDNNAVADPEPVRPVQIRGALWYAIPYLGYATGMRGEDASRVWIPIVAGLVFCYAAVTTVRWAVEKRRDGGRSADRPPGPASDGPDGTAGPGRATEPGEADGPPT